MSDNMIVDAGGRWLFCEQCQSMQPENHLCITNLNAKVADSFYRGEHGGLSYEEATDPVHEVELRAAFRQGYRPEIDENGVPYLHRRS